MLAFLIKVPLVAIPIEVTSEPRGRKPVFVSAGDRPQPQGPLAGATAEHRSADLVWPYRCFPAILNANTVVKPEP
jgi:hypothetical protein